MAKKNIKKESKDSCSCGPHHKAMCGGHSIYGVGFIGAAIYYISHATGFWNGALGILKAIVWPAMLVYKLLGL